MDTMDSEDEDLQLAYRLSLEHPQPGMQQPVPAPPQQFRNQENQSGSDSDNEDAQLQAALLQSMYDLPAFGTPLLPLKREETNTRYSVALGIREHVFPTYSNHNQKNKEDALMAAVIQSLQDTNLTGNPNQTARPAVPAVRNRTAEAGSECSVCFGHIAQDTVPHPYPCNNGSVFCGACQYEQCRVTVQNTEIAADEIRCPCNCGEVWPPELLRHVDETLYDQHMRQLVERRLIRDEPDFRWCQNPACAAGALYPGASAAQPYIICPTCQDAACFLCQSRWEEGHREDCPLHASNTQHDATDNPRAADAQPEARSSNQQDQENIPPALSPRYQHLPRVFRRLLVDIEAQIGLADTTLTQMEQSRHATAQALTELSQSQETQQAALQEAESNLTMLRDQQSEISETLEDIRTARQRRNGPARPLNLGPYNRLMDCMMNLFSQLRGPQSAPVTAMQKAQSDEDSESLVRGLEAGCEELDIQIEVQEERIQTLTEAISDVRLRSEVLSESRIMREECLQDEDFLRELIAQLRCLEERVMHKGSNPLSLIFGSIALRDIRSQKRQIHDSLRTIRQQYNLSENPHAHTVETAPGDSAPVAAGDLGSARNTFLNSARQRAGAAGLGASGTGVVGDEEEVVQAERRIRQRRAAQEEERGRQVAEIRRRDEARMEQHKRCPWCNTPTERTAGCDHMTCSVCTREWCYICMRRYPTHDGCGVSCRAPQRVRRDGDAFCSAR